MPMAPKSAAKGHRAAGEALVELLDEEKLVMLC
jgi:hypothetical protein